MSEVTDLYADAEFTKRQLEGLIGHQGYHFLLITRGQRIVALRIIRSTIPKEVLLKLQVVYVAERAYIAKVTATHQIGEWYDLWLDPFQPFIQTGKGPRIAGPGTHVILGPSTRSLKAYPRNKEHEPSSLRPPSLPSPK